MDKPTKRIGTITVRRMQDDNPDTSHLGEYLASFSEYCIDRRTGCLYGTTETVTVNETELQELKDDEDEKIASIDENFTREGETETTYEVCKYIILARNINTQHPDRNSMEYIGKFQHLPHNEKNWAHVTKEARTKASEKERAALAKYKINTGEHWKDLDILYCVRDAERLEDMERGEWSMVGIEARATIHTGTNGHSLINHLESGGLWGIESDCEDYHREVAQEQLAELATVLKTFGFTDKEIKKAMPKKTFEFEDR